MAVSGSLSTMVGGNEEQFNYCPYWNVWEKIIVHIGETGAGHVAKLANQIIVSINLAIVAEASVIASKVSSTF